MRQLISVIIRSLKMLFTKLSTDCIDIHSAIFEVVENCPTTIFNRTFTDMYIDAPIPNFLGIFPCYARCLKSSLADSMTYATSFTRSSLLRQNRHLRSMKQIGNKFPPLLTGDATYIRIDGPIR